MKLHRDTIAARARVSGSVTTGDVIPPIHPATTYARDPAGNAPDGRVYSRDQNPTYDEPERVLAELEGGAGATLWSSGIAAGFAPFQCLLAPGDHVVLPRAMYWALRGAVQRFGARWHVDVSLVDQTDPAAFGAALRPGVTRLVLVETPANPTWEVVDIAVAAELTHGAGAILMVDSTAATPVLTRPIEHGADLVVHSATKYLNGHSDVIAGGLVTARCDESWEQLTSWRASSGAVLGPFEAWLLQRGMRTLPVRVRRMCESAQIIAEALVAHPGVVDVRYPGLVDDPGHAVARRQMDGGFGGMLSIRTAGGEAGAAAVAGALDLWSRATSLGGVESLVEHRAPVEGPTSEVPRDLLRLSVGLEHPEDLLADLAQALHQLR